MADEYIHEVRVSEMDDLYRALTRFPYSGSVTIPQNPSAQRGRDPIFEVSDAIRAISDLRGEVQRGIDQANAQAEELASLKRDLAAVRRVLGTGDQA